MPRGEPGNKDNHYIYALELSNLLSVLILLCLCYIYYHPSIIETCMNIMTLYNYVIYPCNSHDFVSLS